MILHEADGSNSGTDPNTDVKDDEKDQKDPLAGLSKEEIIGILKDTRSEAASRRVEAKELKAKIAEKEAKEKEVSDAKAAKNGEFEKLASERLAEIEILKSKITEKDSELEEFTVFKTTQKATYKEQIGDAWSDEFDTMSLSTLGVLAEKLNVKKKSFDTDGAGVGGNKGEQKMFDELLAKGSKRTAKETRDMQQLGVKLKNASKK